MLKKTYKLFYEVYEDGTVFSLKTNKFLNHTINEKGYHRVFIGNKRESVARVVYSAFNGDIPEGYEIDHIDTNKDNNHISNLRLSTHSENMKNPLTLLKRYKKIGQYLGNKLIKVFGSSTEASKELNICVTSITNCLNGRSKTSGGYNWKYC